MSKNNNKDAIDGTFHYEPSHDVVKDHMDIETFHRGFNEGLTIGIRSNEGHDDDLIDDGSYEAWLASPMHYGVGSAGVRSSLRWDPSTFYRPELESVFDRIPMFLPYESLTGMRLNALYSINAFASKENLSRADRIRAHLRRQGKSDKLIDEMLRPMERSEGEQKQQGDEKPVDTSAEQRHLEMTYANGTKIAASLPLSLSEIEIAIRRITMLANYRKVYFTSIRGMYDTYGRPKTGAHLHEWMFPRFRDCGPYRALLISETSAQENPNYHSSFDGSPQWSQNLLAGVSELLAKCLPKDKPDSQVDSER